ncbi:MAG: DNA polymerase IV [Cytophagales bacterium]|nr:MAG: DNA polymerase IV [Cytophagales bacterium]
MDAFFASVEQRDDESLKNKPVAVGGSEQRGVVAAASYEARKYGVRSAMPSIVAKRKCPQLIFVKPRFEVYKQVSMQIRSIFQEYTDLIEPLSLDEAYLDVTENKKNNPSATLIAKEIKQKILELTKLTASAGVSFNKFLAKIASDFQKPDGLTTITPEKAEAFINELPIEKFYGIGKVTAQKMNQMGVFNGFDLKNIPIEILQKKFGKFGTFYFHIVRGEDDRNVNPDRVRKSLGAENTFVKDLNTIEECMKELREIEDIVVQRLKKASLKGKTITLKVKFADFEQITRSHTLLYPTQDRYLIDSVIKKLILQINLEKSIRLLGVSLSSLTEANAKDNQLLIPFLD